MNQRELKRKLELIYDTRVKITREGGIRIKKSPKNTNILSKNAIKEHPSWCFMGWNDYHTLKKLLGERI